MAYPPSNGCCNLSRSLKFRSYASAGAGEGASFSLVMRTNSRWNHSIDSGMDASDCLHLVANVAALASSVRRAVAQ